MNYTTVYQNAASAFHYYEIFMVVVCLIAGLFLMRPLIVNGKVKKGVYFICGLSIVHLFLRLYGEFNKQSTTIIGNKYRDMDVNIVEGTVENFHAMPLTGHDFDTFTVKNKTFKYSDYFITEYFNQTASHGGPIKENGQQVRLSYVTFNNENQIVKIEMPKQ